MYIVITGTFSDGFKFYGPYDTFDDASDSLEAKYPGSWIASLLKPL
jgi:hypothetical protein